MKQFQFEYSNAAAFREELIRLKQRHEITSQTAIVFQIYSEGNTAQRAPDGFARHMLAYFSSYFTKMLVNT